jgi:hypothetical protein
MPVDDDTASRIRDYRAFLDGLGSEGRVDFVDAARRNEDWPSPQRAFLVAHARKWGRGRQADAYSQWAYDTKNRAGVRVYAYIHAVHLTRGVAFVDMAEDVVVHFDCDGNLNFDCFSPSTGVERAIKDWVARGTHWRLRDTER